MDLAERLRRKYRPSGCALTARRGLGVTDRRMTARVFGRYAAGCSRRRPLALVLLKARHAGQRAGPVMAVFNARIRIVLQQFLAALVAGREPLPGQARDLPRFPAAFSAETWRSVENTPFPSRTFPRGEDFLRPSPRSCPPAGDAVAFSPTRPSPPRTAVTDAAHQTDRPASSRQNASAAPMRQSVQLREEASAKKVYPPLLPISLRTPMVPILPTIPTPRRAASLVPPPGIIEKFPHSPATPPAETLSRKEKTLVISKRLLIGKNFSRPFPRRRAATGDALAFSRAHSPEQRLPVAARVKTGQATLRHPASWQRRGASTASPVWQHSGNRAATPAGKGHPPLLPIIPGTPLILSTPPVHGEQQNSASAPVPRRTAPHPAAPPATTAPPAPAAAGRPGATAALRSASPLFPPLALVWAGQETPLPAAPDTESSRAATPITMQPSLHQSVVAAVPPSSAAGAATGGLPPAASPALPRIDLNRLANEVCRRLEQKLITERERRGR